MPFPFIPGPRAAVPAGGSPDPASGSTASGPAPARASRISLPTVGGLMRRVTACFVPATADDMAPRASLGRLRDGPVAAQASASTPNPQATAAGAESTAPGVAPRRRHEPQVGDGKRGAPLLQHQINESGYLAARAAMGKPIEDPGDLRRLVEGNDTQFAIHQRLHFGRGNVEPDRIASGGTGAKRTHAAQNWALFYKDNPNQAAAATTYMLQAGNCSDHAVLAVRLHGLKLQGQESVHRVSNDKVDHSFVEVRTPDRPAVTVDPWANGPAMQSGDTVWADPQVSPHTETIESFDTESGPVAWAGLRQQVEFFQHKGRRNDLNQSAMRASGGKPKVYGRSTQLAKGYNKQPGFGDAARAALEGHKPLQQEVLAVGVMRDAYKLNVGQAASQAQSVLQAAKTLDTMPDELARPPVRKPQK